MHFLRPFVLVFAAIALFGFQTADPWRANELFDAATIAAKLKSKPADQPLILQVGFQALYKSVRIPHAKYAGPGSTAEGIANLEQQLKASPRTGPSCSIAAAAPGKSAPTFARPLLSYTS